MTTLFKYLKGDRVIWMVALLLALVSIPAVYSSIVTLAYKYQEGNTFYYLIKHGIMVVTGFVLMYYTHKIKFTYFSRISQILIWLVIALLGLTLMVGVNLNDASRWLTIPVINQNFQTSDFAKLVLIIYVSRLLATRQEKITSFKEAVVPILLPILAVCGLILPANFSTAAVLFATCMVIMFVGRIALKHLALIFGTGLTGLAILLLIAQTYPDLMPRAETWRNRVMNYSSGETKANYQVEQAKIAIATGGLIGQGPSKGKARNTLPHPYSDMIYAFIIQEYGSIIGGLGVLMLYLILLFRAIRIANRCEKSFGVFVAVGLSFSLVFQALINMAVAVNLLPVTGQPLPLVSMGGTSIWFTCISIGVVLSVSRSVYPENEEVEEGQYAIA